MKKFIILLSFAISFQLNTKAQVKLNEALPDFKLLLLDSTSTFSCADLKPNTYTFIIHFSPECEHCEKEISSLLANYTKFKNSQFILSAYFRPSVIKEFCKKHQLDSYPNIIVASETDRSLSKIFAINYIPYVAVFDQQQHLIKTFEGESPIEDWIKLAQ